MATIINRTPHDITIMPLGATSSDRPIAILPAAKRGEVARVEQTTTCDGRIVTTFDDDGEESIRIPIGRAAWGQVVGLPAPDHDVYHVVSVIVAEAAVDAGRTINDLLVPGDQVRDDRGRIVGCRGLVEAVTASPAMSGRRASEAAGAIHRRLDPEAMNMRPHPDALVVEAERMVEAHDSWVKEAKHLRLLGGFAYNATEAHGALRVAVLGMCRRIVGEVLSDLDLGHCGARDEVLAKLFVALSDDGESLPLGRSGHDYVAGWPNRTVTPPPSPK